MCRMLLFGLSKQTSVDQLSVPVLQTRKLEAEGVCVSCAGAAARQWQGWDLSPGLWAAFLQLLARHPGAWGAGRGAGAGVTSGSVTTTPWNHPWQLTRVDIALAWHFGKLCF